MSQQTPMPAAGVSNDARAMMMFDANKKSMVVAYLLWFFLGGFGGHRFYTGQTGSAIAQLVMWLGGIILTFVGIGLVILGILYIWVLVDAFLIPGWIRNQNSQLVAQLSA